jgi:hypothetical protein
VIGVAGIAVVGLVIGVLVFRPFDDGTTGPGGGPSVSVSRTADGANWQLLVTSTPTGQEYASLALRLVRPDGTTNLSLTPLASLDRFTNGCTLERANPASSRLAVGDRVLCAAAWYPTGTQYLISNGATIIAAGELR